MSAVSKQYETIMNEIDTLKIEENITDIDIQKQLLQFTTQFKSASNFMKNAANLIIDGANNSTPTNETIENKTSFRTCGSTYCHRFIYFK